MPEYFYAILSAFLWAASAPILNIGIDRLPVEHRRSAILFALFIALLTGTISLYFFTSFSLTENIHTVNPYIVLAGVLTFPIATGLYYSSAYAFGSKTEIASQFAKVKPLFSIALAVLVLGEIMSFTSWLAVFMIAISVLILASAAFAGKISWQGVILGLMTAGAWALGEMFVKLGFSDGATLDNSFMALFSSLVFMAVFVLPLITRFFQLSTLRWIVPFSIHGILSFAIAYTCFFKSITDIGLSKTVLITAFWPILAILLSALVSRMKGHRYTIDNRVWVAAIILVSASLVQLSVYF